MQKPPEENPAALAPSAPPQQQPDQAPELAPVVAAIVVNQARSEAAAAARDLAARFPKATPAQMAAASEQTRGAGIVAMRTRLKAMLLAA